jgi:CRISPR-associated endoribonuclease Cas6
MRIKITLETSGNRTVPINSNHFISAAIYDYLSESDIEFSTKLHFGYHTLSKKDFKFFTFSRLEIPRKIINDSEIKILSKEIYLYISSPWNEFIQNFINGMLNLGVFRLGNKTFDITKIETLKNDIKRYENTNDYIYFKCLSPLVITTKKEYQGELKKYYYKPDDDHSEIVDKIKNNLINKYEAFYGKKPENHDFNMEFNKDYLLSGKAKVLSHYIKDDKDIKIPSILCPFKIKGNYDIIFFGYECGFGEMNSAGFGMVDIIE